MPTTKPGLAGRLPTKHRAHTVGLGDQDHTEGAKFVELSSDDHVIWAGDTDRAIDEIEEFLTGVRPSPTSERVLLTVLFTDIVGSTALAAVMGDHRWKEMLKRHDHGIRTELRRYGGSAIKSTGDGFLAAFQGQPALIQCANAVRE